MILKEEKRGSNVIISELVPDILLTLQVLNATRQEPSFNSSLFLLFYQTLQERITEEWPFVRQFFLVKAK